MSLRLCRLVSVLLLIALLAGCATGPENDQRQARQLYTSAHNALTRGDYETAVKDYEKLEGKFPFGPYAEQAQLDLILAYKRMAEPDSAIAAAERFIRLNPRSDKVPYAWYMKGVVDQERGTNIVTNFFDLDRAARDPKPLEHAFDAFRTLIQRYPDSKYTADARRRMKDIRSALADHQLQIARFYAKRNEWVATANRAIGLIQRYPNTDAVGDALKLLEQSYNALKLGDLRDDVRRVLKANGIKPG
ncbi:MAG TPA: outer membrane protein assembly factor BamD [Gammaproteobacteria bacterium]|nr:outer membrane protein assembly factor BamD [Gammaproteobacteria bacterium]